MKNKINLSPVFWGSLIFVIGAGLTSFVAHRELAFLQANPQIEVPEVAPQFPVIYFFSAVVVIGLILFFIPISILKLVFRLLFVLLFAWGIFVVLGLTLPSLILVSVIAGAGGLVWFFKPVVWLHDLLMLFSLVGVGAVFGILLPPWPIMIFLLVVAIYDFLAVQFGYMMWMAKKMSQSDSLPAFIIPKTWSKWIYNLRAKNAENIIEGEASEREFAILGGGDIGFPLILMVSVLADSGFLNSIIIAAFSLAGLVGAFAIQRLFLKGKPMPALPPIALSSLVGLLIIKFVAS